MPAIWLDVDTALAEVPVNSVPLIDDTDFKTREESVVYNQAGLDLVWNFVTSAGAFTQTAVTPTDTGGLHDWVNQGNGMYTIEIPASTGTINNDTEGYGWFTGYATGILPWAGPIIGFRAAGLNDLLIDSAYNATRGLTGTALPAAAADAAGGVPISDAGGLDIDTKLANTNEVTSARMGALTDWINGGRLDLILDIIAADVVNIDGEAMRGTDNAALASVCTEARLAELGATNVPADLDTLKTRVPSALSLTAGNVHSHTKATDVGGDATLANQVAIKAVTDLINGLLEDSGGYRYTAKALEEAPSGAGLTDTQNTALILIRDIMEGDATINTSTTPWQLVVKKKSTDTEVLKKNLKDVNGVNIAAVTTVIGQQLEP